jgi:amidophosphoribosyltransferase
VLNLLVKKEFGSNTVEVFDTLMPLIEEMRELIGADTLSFLSPAGTVEAIDRPFDGETRGQCMACFTGKYPTEIFPDTVLPHQKC